MLTTRADADNFVGRASKIDCGATHFPEKSFAAIRPVVFLDGQPVNPSGIRNQVEGGIIQSLSWTNREQVTFSDTHRTSFDWSAYPILRFEDVPDPVDVHIVDRP